MGARVSRAGSAGPSYSSFWRSVLAYLVVVVVLVLVIVVLVVLGCPFPVAVGVPAAISTVAVRVIARLAEVSRLSPSAA